VEISTLSKHSGFQPIEIVGLPSFPGPAMRDHAGMEDADLAMLTSEDDERPTRVAICYVACHVAVKQEARCTAIGRPEAVIVS
jgi:methenyltetrahydromethanopterin cyclohydrolase